MNPNDPSNDRDLRERFAALRREDASQAPEFDAVLRHARRSKTAWSRWAAAAAMVVVAAVLLVKFYPRPAPPTQSITEWKSPTDFLLETPGRDLLQTMPSFGPWTAEPPPSESPTPAGKKKS